jgi:hypothetical protein
LCVVRLCGRIMVSLTLALTLVTLTLTLVTLSLTLGGQIWGVCVVTGIVRQRNRPKHDGGGGWVGLRLGRAWAGLLPRRETAYVALARAPRLAGSTFAWVGRRTGWTAALGCPCCSPDPRGGWVSLGLGARGPHRYSGGMTTLRVWVVRPLERPRTPRAPGPQSALTARATRGAREHGHEG